MKLTDNYTLAEVTRSDIANSIGHTIIATQVQVDNATRLAQNVLQQINDFTGWQNQVSSWLRDDVINFHPDVKGSKTSDHRHAKASDNKFYEVDSNGIFARWVKPIEIARVVKKLDLNYDQMILYNSFVHLSYRSFTENRNMILYNSFYKGERL